MFGPPNIVLEQGGRGVIPHRDDGVHGGCRGRRGKPMEDELARCRRSDLPCLDNDDALVPCLNCLEELGLHGQGGERDQLLGVLVLDPQKLGEGPQVTQQLLDLGPELRGDCGGDVDRHSTSRRTLASCAMSGESMWSRMTPCT